MSRYAAERRAAIAAALEAGSLIRHEAGRPRDVREKAEHDLVTATDEAAQRLILGRLADAFPDYAVLAEENDRQDGDAATPPGRPRWIVDPIDGTTNFAHGVSPYCVSIALQDAEGALVVGVVYEITLDELFAAEHGEGLTVNGRPARVSTAATLPEALVTTGFPFRDYAYMDAFLDTFRAVTEKTRGVRRPGSAATDLAWTACGRYDAFFEAGLAPWDVAAGIVLVREGGGTVSGLIDSADPLADGQLLASNGALHEAMRPLVRPLGEAYAAMRG